MPSKLDFKTPVRNYKAQEELPGLAYFTASGLATPHLP